jgi:hypothetical protein
MSGLLEPLAAVAHGCGCSQCAGLWSPQRLAVTDVTLATEHLGSHQSQRLRLRFFHTFDLFSR